MICIKELGFDIHSTFKTNEVNRRAKNQNSIWDKGESSSKSSSGKDRGLSPINLQRRKSLVDDESFNALSTGATKNEVVDVSRQIGEEFISGGSKIKFQDETRCNQEIISKEGNGIEERTSGKKQSEIAIFVKHKRDMYDLKVFALRKLLRIHRVEVVPIQACTIACLNQVGYKDTVKNMIESSKLAGDTGLGALNEVVEAPGR
ncbi:hypothetical protein V6N13_088781 [Hibiscus sabdariffa]